MKLSYCKYWFSSFCCYFGWISEPYGNIRNAFWQLNRRRKYFADAYAVLHSFFWKTHLREMLLPRELLEGLFTLNLQQSGRKSRLRFWIDFECDLADLRVRPSPFHKSIGQPVIRAILNCTFFRQSPMKSSTSMIPSTISFDAHSSYWNRRREELCENKDVRYGWHTIGHPSYPFRSNDRFVLSIRDLTHRSDGIEFQEVTAMLRQIRGLPISK